MEEVTVVAISREPLEVTLRFLAWHRRLGARLRIYLDDPDDPVMPWIAGLDWVEPVRCTPEVWAALGVDPEAPFPQRQLAALTDGYRAVRSGWVAVADADELFWFADRRFDEVVAGLPESLCGLRIGTAELVGQREASLHFRLPMTRRQCDAVYGPDAVLFRPTEGLIGHRVGKSITRAGLKLRRMRPHWAVGPRRRDLTELKWPAGPDAALLHLINPDYATWRQKLPWRMAAQGGISPRIKAAVLQAQAATDPEAALQDLFMRLYRMDDPALDRLREAGVHLALKSDMLALTRSVFPGAPVPLP